MSDKKPEHQNQEEERQENPLGLDQGSPEV